MQDVGDGAVQLTPDSEWISLHAWTEPHSSCNLVKSKTKAKPFSVWKRINSILLLANNTPNPMYKQLKELRVSLDKLLIKQQISWKNPKLLLGRKVRDIRIGIISKTFLGINFFFTSKRKRSMNVRCYLLKVVSTCRTPNCVGSSCPASSAQSHRAQATWKDSKQKEIPAAESTVFTGNTTLRIFPMCFNYSCKEGNILWIT